MRKQNTILFYFAVFLFLSIFLLILGKTGILNAPSGFISKIFTPLRGIPHSAVYKNKSLDVDQASQLEKLKKENKALSDQFQVSNPRSSTLTPATVIGSPSFIPGVTFPEELIIDSGSADGIKIGQAVVLGSNLVGTISKINSSNSKVILVTNKNFVTTGKIESGAIGVIKGVGDGIEIGNLLLSQDIKTGSKVLTKGSQDLDGSGIPPDLIVGEITSVDKKASSLFQNASIKSYVDFSKISNVFVITK